MENKTGKQLNDWQSNDAEIAKSERLSTLISKLDFSQRAFASQAGISPTSVSQVLANSRRLTAEMVRKIKAAFPDVNAAWLLDGIGPMLLPPGITVPTVQEDAPPYESDRIIEMQAEIKRLSEQINQLSADLRERGKIDDRLLGIIESMTKQLEALTRRGDASGEMPPTRAKFVKQEQ